MSFGLPQRDGINTAFLTMAIASGLTSAITNPLHADIVKACMAADVMMGHDADCTQWIRKFRETPPVGADGEAGRGRRDSWVTATTLSPSASAKSDSVAEGTRLAMRMGRLCHGSMGRRD